MVYWEYILVPDFIFFHHFIGLSRGLCLNMPHVMKRLNARFILVQQCIGHVRFCHMKPVWFEKHYWLITSIHNIELLY